MADHTKIDKLRSVACLSEIGCYVRTTGGGKVTYIHHCLLSPVVGHGERRDRTGEAMDQLIICNGRQARDVSVAVVNVADLRSTERTLLFVVDWPEIFTSLWKTTRSCSEHRGTAGPWKSSNGIFIVSSGVGK